MKISLLQAANLRELCYGVDYGVHYHHFKPLYI
jgi:hypothetical protein